jgi:hypothetical protein
MNISTPTGRIFMKFDIREFFQNLVREFKLHSYLVRITGTLHEDQYKLLIIFRSILLRMRNVSDKFVEKIQTNLMSSNLFFFFFVIASFVR